MRKLRILYLLLAFGVLSSAPLNASYRPTLVTSAFGAVFLVATAILGSLTAKKDSQLHASYSGSTLIVDGYNTTKTSCEVCGGMTSISVGCEKYDYTSQLLCSYAVWENGTAQSLQTPALKICGDSANDAAQNAQSSFPLGSTAGSIWYEISHPASWVYSLWSKNGFLPYTITSACLSAAGLITGLACGIREKCRRTYGYTPIP